MTDRTLHIVQVGDEVPDVTLMNERGKEVRLHDLAGSTTILYFYPFDASPSCTTQACALRDSWPLLRNEGIEVFGVNSGSVQKHERFHGRYGLPFSLLVDEKNALASRFGFVHALPIISGTVTRVERSTVIIDPDLTIRAIMRRVKADAHFDLLRVQLQLPPQQPALSDDAA